MNKETMTIYRVYTENAPNLTQQAAKYFPEGYILTEGSGEYYDHPPEHSAVIELWTPDTERVRNFACVLGLLNHQQEVTVTQHEVEVFSVTPGCGQLGGYHT